MVITVLVVVIILVIAIILIVAIIMLTIIKEVEKKSRKEGDPTCIKFFMPVLSTRLLLLTGASSLRDFNTKPAKFRQFRLLVFELQ